MQVKINDLLEDADKRRAGRTFKIEAILDNKALVKVLSNPKKGPIFTKIRLSRFTPKYYKLILNQPVADVGVDSTDLYWTEPPDTDLTKISYSFSDNLKQKSLFDKCMDVFDKYDTFLVTQKENCVELSLECVTTFKCQIFEGYNNSYTFTISFNDIVFDSWSNSFDQCVFGFRSWLNEFKAISHACDEE
jgi:hypothetical protein